MFSTTTATSSRQDQGYGKSYTPQIPKGFTVRVFKGSSIYSQPQTTAAAFDRGYQSIPLAGPRQSIDSRNWHQPQNSSSKTSSAATEAPKTSHPQSSAGVPSATDNRLVRYDSNSRPSPGYSIYQGSKDTYVYEASVSSKGDAYSNSEDDAVTGEYTPSSAFSPALSMDSITTLRGAMTPDVSTAELPRSAPAPTPTRTSSFIPSLSQAQTAIKGFFRSQTPNISQPSTDPSYIPRSASTTPTSSISSTGPTRNGTPFPPSETSGSGQRGTGGMPSGAHVPPSQNQNFRQESSQPSTPVLDAEESDDESDTELDNIARANAEYNAAASRQGSPTRPYYTSARDSIHFPAVASEAGSAGDAARQLYPNLPLRSSPEQYHAQATTPHNGENSSYYKATETTKPQIRATSDSEDTVRSLQSSTDIRSRGWSASEERRQPSSRPLPVPPGQQPAPPIAAQMSRSQSTGPAPNRYVPASRTMTSPEPTSALEQSVSISTAPPGTYPQRERRASGMSRIAPVLPPSQAPAPHEVGGVGPIRSGPQGHETRRDGSDIQASYAQHRRESPPATQEHYSLGTSSLHGLSNIPSNRHTLVEMSHETFTPRYVGSNVTQPINSVSSQPSFQTPAEQMYYTSSQQRVQQARGSAPPPVTTSMASSYATSSHNHASNSPPRVRHDSVAGQTSARRPISIYAPPNPTSNGAYQRDGEYSARAEAERHTNGNFTNPYTRSANDPPGHSVSDYEGRGGARNASSGRSNIRHSPPYVQAPPSTISSDPGPVLDHRRDLPSQYAWPGQGRHGVPTSSSTRHHEGFSSNNTSDPSYSQMDFPAPRRDPERRYSESDGPIASNSTYAPAYASYASTATDPRSTIPIEHQPPQRRYSDGDQANPSNAQDHTSLTLFRTVRWNENLVCPSPIFSHQRRKGWFNRRGDQLWTNDGAYKPSPAGQEYPTDLSTYPEHGEGWMNEQGVRIDMGHRLIPKAPLKSAMKSNRTAQPTVPVKI